MIATGEKESQSLRHKLVSRIAYIVYRENKKQREKNVGLEANPILVRRYCLSIHEIFITNYFTRIENDSEEFRGERVDNTLKIVYN